MSSRLRARTRPRFPPWTAAVRASVDAVQRLADEAREKERVLRKLLHRTSPDAAAIGSLVIELDACCKKIERIRRATLASFRRIGPSSTLASDGARSSVGF